MVTEIQLIEFWAGRYISTTLPVTAKLLLGGRYVATTLPLEAVLEYYIFITFLLQNILL